MQTGDRSAEFGNHGIERLQPHVYGADQVERSKPHPDVYLLAASGLASAGSRSNFAVGAFSMFSGDEME